MENSIYTVSPGTTGIAITETMTDGNFRAVPIVEKAFALAGLESKFNLLRVMEEENGLRKYTVEDIMTRNAANEKMLLKDLIYLLQ